MDLFSGMQNNFFGLNLFSDFQEYMEDAVQRSTIYMDILRKRGNIYIEHAVAGKPPVLSFDYKMVLDGREFEKPVNYALIKILPKDLQPIFKEEGATSRKGVLVDAETVQSSSKKRPVVIIDPRAGHGPGIGGSKKDSEIGMALNLGHPVYFFIFFPDPQPGQSIEAVQRAEVKFLEKVVELHPKAEMPVIIGNCQGGWAAALLGADRPDVTGPLIFNGSPLSYWSGVEGKNPMRYKGGLTGGTWMTSLWSDLGNGKFDGANLVHGFEDLNPGNAKWSKQYNLYSKVDTEEERYLEFERWWNGFFYMTGEGIHFIVDNLFVGNKLEQGLLELDQDTRVDLKNIINPILVFASSGDNITPPQQALNWIVKVWGTVEGLKKHEQVVVYLVHEDIGHLGIFVSGKVSQKEHNEIISSIDLIEYLAPGLYEMIITDKEDGSEEGGYEVTFAERDMSDILAIDTGDIDDEDFRVVAAVSDHNDEMYKEYLSPFVKMLATEEFAEALRQSHPLRWKKYMFADQKNPFMAQFESLALEAKKNRKIVSKDNFFLGIEKIVSETIEKTFQMHANLRDDTQEYMFRAIFGDPLLQSMFESRVQANEEKEKALQTDVFEKKHKEQEQRLFGLMDKGDFLDGILRITVAMTGADRIIDRKELQYIRELVTVYNVLGETTEPQLKRKMRDQARIVRLDQDRALNALPTLIEGAENRLVAIQLAESLAIADDIITEQEQEMLDKIKKLLDDKKTLD